MRAAAYARVSSAVQRERDTIASQLRTLPEYIAAQGWTLVGTYADDGKSAGGALAERAGMLRCMADAASGLFDVLVVVDFDRITRARSLGERGLILDAFRDAGVQIVSSSGKVFDLATEHGELMATLEGHAAAAWLRKHKERIVQGKVTAALRGRKPAGPTLYGYRYARATGAWTIDEAEAAIVRECFRRVAAGESCYAICVDLQDRGELRPRGGRWNRGRVWTLVTQRGYVGELTVDKARALTVRVPPIVDEALFVAAQAQLPHNRAVPRAPRGKAWNLLEGIARCGECGEKIGITGGGPRGKGWRYYVCYTQRASPQERAARGWVACTNRMRRVEQLDEEIWARLRRVVERPDLAAEAVEHRRASADPHDWQAELEGYTRQIAALERAEAVILDRFRRGRVSEAAMDRELEAASRQRQLLERNRALAAQELASARRTRAEADALEASLEGLRARLDAATPEERQQIARALVPGHGGLQVTLWRDRRPEIVGTLSPSATISRADATVSSSEPPGDAGQALLFRVVT